MGARCKTEFKNVIVEKRTKKKTLTGGEEARKAGIGGEIRGTLTKQPALGGR